MLFQGSQTKKRIVLIAILAGISITTAVFSGQIKGSPYTYYQQQKEMKKLLAKRVDGDKERLPIVMNENITYQAIALNDKTVEMLFVINVPGRTAKALKPLIEPLVREHRTTSCSNEQMRDFMQYGVNYLFTYITPENEEIRNLLLTPQSCNITPSSWFSPVVE